MVLLLRLDLSTRDVTRCGGQVCREGVCATLDDKQGQWLRSSAMVEFWCTGSEVPGLN